MMAATTLTPEVAVSKPYDFVIIGGGTAGLTIAARLTEDSTINVLVLEAGENKIDDPKINIPALMSQLYEDQNYDWSFKTAPQPALNNRVIAQPRGKVLGGTSSLNFMMLAHASWKEMDAWASLYPNSSWNAANLLPYYRKFETYNAPEKAIGDSLAVDIIDPTLHGADGPVQISFPFATDELDASWRKTFKTLGLAAEKDPRKGDTLGAYSILKFIDKEGRRSSSATAFYAPNADRKNLTVLTNALVNKIVFDQANGELVATGVSFSAAGRDYIASAVKEVILSAGSFQSPQILELSGIGSREVLEKHNINVLVENPNVGENLQDHPLVSLNFETKEGVPTAETIKQPGVLDWALEEWSAGRGGPLASGVSGTAFLSYETILPPESRLNILSSAATTLGKIPIKDNSAKAFEIQKRSFLDQKEADIQFNFAKTGFNPYSPGVSGFLNHTDPGNFAGVATVLTHPFSRGSVHISSASPSAHPTIDPGYLTHPLDVSILTDAILFIQTLVQTQPLSEFFADNPTGGKKVQPSFKIDATLDRTSAEKHVRNTLGSSWHPIATCSMLPKDDGGVVDDRLRVYGVKGLRVVDASVIPLHIRGNIASSVFAVAEKAADLVKEDWGRK